MLTLTQLEVLKYMRDNNIGAFPVNGTWIFPHAIRKNNNLATEIRTRLFIVKIKGEIK